MSNIQQNTTIKNNKTKPKEHNDTKQMHIRKRKRNQNEKWNKKPTSQIMKSNHQEKFQTPTCKMQKKRGGGGGGNKSYKHKGLETINKTKCKGKAHQHCDGACT